MSTIYELTSDFKTIKSSIEETKSQSSSNCAYEKEEIGGSSLNDQILDLDNALNPIKTSTEEDIQEILQSFK